MKFWTVLILLGVAVEVVVTRYGKDVTRYDEGMEDDEELASPAGSGHGKKSVCCSPGARAHTHAQIHVSFLDSKRKKYFV